MPIVKLIGYYCGARKLAYVGFADLAALRLGVNYGLLLKSNGKFLRTKQLRADRPIGWHGDYLVEIIDGS